VRFRLAVLSAAEVRATALGDRFYRKAKEKVEQRIGEPVHVLGWASRTGAMGAVIAGQVLRGADVAGGNPIGLGTSIPGSRVTGPGGEKGARLPINFLVALTPTAMRLFSVRNGWTGVKVKKELGALPREGLRLGVEDGGITKRFLLHGADGSAVAFEMTRSKFATTFADDLKAALPSG
jgi:hypothetical protein